MTNTAPAKSRRSRIILLSLGVVVVAAAVSTALAPTPLRQVTSRFTEARAAAPAPAAAAALVPSRLRVPSIGVDARVESVGITSAGTMGVPTDVHDVGWYALGVHPSQPGDAVIDGHLTASNGVAVFSKLALIKAGDTVEVDFSDGSIHRFRAQRVAAYAWNDRPPQLFATGGEARLSLVTCSGTWDGKAYSQRVVVDATLAD